LSYKLSSQFILNISKTIKQNKIKTTKIILQLHENETGVKVDQATDDNQNDTPFS